VQVYQIPPSLASPVIGSLPVGYGRWVYLIFFADLWILCGRKKTERGVLFWFWYLLSTFELSKLARRCQG